MISNDKFSIVVAFYLKGIFNLHIDNFLILRFLRICEFNIEETKLRIRNYYKHRSELPEWYKKKDPFLPELQELLDLG